MTEIIPAIIPKNLNIIRDRFDKILGLVKKVQIDIVDGEYASTKTWPFNANQFEEMRAIVGGEERFPFIDDFILEIDMLTLHPIEYLGDFISLGAKSFIIHIDSTDHVEECLETIKSASCKIGLGIKPSGDISLLESFLPEADFVQFMGSLNIMGTIEEINVRYTVIRTFDKRRTIIPNSIVVSTPIKTLKSETLIRGDIKIRLPRYVDINQIKSLLIQILNNIDGVLHKEYTNIVVTGFDT